jgi:ABC-2 type transport system ATP-binding protein
MTYGTRSVSVRFGAIEALSSVTLSAPSGSVTALVGGDGAGKTTLLRVLAGLVAPDAGSVDRPPPERVGYLPTGAGSWPNLTVDENMSFVGQAFGLTRTELGERTGDLLARAGLASARQRLARELSGGMRNKLGFCLAMVGRPELLVLDEPTTGVDPVSRVELWRLIAQAAAEGAAVVIATTYMDEAERASRVALLDRGRILMAGTPDDVIASFEGDVVRTDAPRHPEFSWRSGAGYREWWPSGAPMGSEVVSPHLGDVAIVSEIEASGRTSPGPEDGA